MPPLLTKVNKTWPSEGVLVKRLIDEGGEAHAIDVFTAFRHSFVTESDFRKMAELGVKTVRLPINWGAFADALAPIAPDVYGKFNAKNTTVVVPDPYYVDEVKLVTLPRDFLEDLIIRGHRHGLKFLVDMHAYPSGNAKGTFNTVWPNEPVFWHKNARIGKDVRLTDVGFMVVDAFLGWADSLQGEAKAGLAGVTLMNEPAHLAGFTPQDKTYCTVEELLSWLGAGTKKYLSSDLPSKGIKLYMNVMETAFPGMQLSKYVKPWWESITTAEQRNTVAVIDRHWYVAWMGTGGAASTLGSGVAITCDAPLEEVVKAMKKALWTFEKRIAANANGLVATSEFSSTTYLDAALACDDLDVTRAWLEAQMDVFNRLNVEPFFWTWKMPYGPNFERGWSLKFIAGLQEGPAPHPCELEESKEVETSLGSQAWNRLSGLIYG